MFFIAEAIITFDLRMRAIQFKTALKSKGSDEFKALARKLLRKVRDQK